MNMNEIERDTEKLANLLGTTSDSQKALIWAYLADARMTGFEDGQRQTPLRVDNNPKAH